MTPDPTTPPVTLLYAPADRPELVRKALRGDADVVAVDLEDAVAPDRKVSARDDVAGLLADASGRAAQVRINPLDGPWGEADLRMVDALPPGVGLRLPKVRSATDVEQVTAALASPRALHCLVETADGVQDAPDLARAGAASLALGEADLLSELGDAPELLAWARMRVVVAARAAGLPAPMQSVWTAVRDLDGLAASCRSGRGEGFVGRAAIHPSHLPVIRDAYRPAERDVARARRVLEHLESARDVGRGTAVTPEGEFLDEAMVRGALATLALDRACDVAPR